MRYIVNLSVNLFVNLSVNLCFFVRVFLCACMCLFPASFLTGCAQIKNNLPNNATAARDYADQLADAAQYKKVLVNTTPFIYTTYQKINKKGVPVTIYIEGDGHSRENRYKVANDPTPHNPIGLKLALLDNNPNVVYLARPCQYTSHDLDKACTKEVWSGARFTPKVIASMNEAISNIKKDTKASRIHLIGYSGGAALAVLIAARRDSVEMDIGSLCTVAGDLDHDALSRYHQTTPLPAENENPKQKAYLLGKIPQHHFAGSEDSVVPLSISYEFINVDRKPPYFIKRTVFKGVSHHKGWEQVWPLVLNNEVFEVQHSN